MDEDVEDYDNDHAGDAGDYCPDIEGQEDAYCDSGSFSCSHLVSPLGFLFLARLEFFVGPTDLSVKKIFVDKLEEPLLSALSHAVCSVLEESKKKVKVANFHAVTCNDGDSVEAFVAIIQSCRQNLGYTSITVGGQIGKEGWDTLAEGADWGLGDFDISSTRQAMHNVLILQYNDSVSFMTQYSILSNL